VESADLLPTLHHLPHPVLEPRLCQPLWDYTSLRHQGTRETWAELICPTLFLALHSPLVQPGGLWGEGCRDMQNGPLSSSQLASHSVAYASILCVPSANTVGTKEMTKMCSLN
jgi:hypothetical protein